MAMSTQQRLTALTRGAQARRRQVDEALHSVRMEGLDVDPASGRDGQAYVEGDLSADELVDRVVSRYSGRQV